MKPLQTKSWAVIALVAALACAAWYLRPSGDTSTTNPIAGRTDSSGLSRSAQSRMDERRQRVSGKVDPRLAALADLVARFAEVDSDESRKALSGEFNAWFNELLEREGRDGASAVLADFLRSGMDAETGVLVMSRLGGYFQQIGDAYNEEANQLREKTDDATKAEVLRLDELSNSEFLNAARVFAKLQQRFPDDPLAGHTGVRAGYNYMCARHYNQAINLFTAVYYSDFPSPSCYNYNQAIDLFTAVEANDDSDLRAQALYWMGLSYERMPVDGLKDEGENRQSAYSSYRRVSIDFPDSHWAEYARCRLDNR